MSLSQGQRDKGGGGAVTQGLILRHLCAEQCYPNNITECPPRTEVCLRGGLHPIAAQAKLASLWEERDSERQGAQGWTADLYWEGCTSLQKQLLKSRAYLLSSALRETYLVFGGAHVARPTGQS